MSYQQKYVKYKITKQKYVKYKTKYQALKLLTGSGLDVKPGLDVKHVMILGATHEESHYDYKKAILTHTNHTLLMKHNKLVSSNCNTILYVYLGWCITLVHYFSALYVIESFFEAVV